MDHSSGPILFSHLSRIMKVVMEFFSNGIKSRSLHRLKSAGGRAGGLDFGFLIVASGAALGATQSVPDNSPKAPPAAKAEANSKAATATAKTYKQGTLYLRKQK